MGFQEILRALPMTDKSRGLELELETSEFNQMANYEDKFKRMFAANAGIPTPTQVIVTQTSRPLGNAGAGGSGSAAHRSLSHAILARADPLSATYPHARRDDLAEYVRQKMLAFVNNPIHVAALGRRKCYEAGWFFERPRPYLDNATPQYWAALSEILTALLGISVIARPEANEDAANSKAKADMLLYGGRHKWTEVVLKV